MSGNAQKWAWSVPLKNRTDKLVLVALAWYADKSGEVWASQTKMQNEIGISRSGLKLKLKRLVDAGLITCETRFGSNGRQTTNNYALNMGGVTIGEPHPVHSEVNPPGTVQGDPHETQFKTQKGNTICGKPQVEDNLGNIQDVLDGFEPLPKDEIIAKANRDHHGNLKPAGCGYLWKKFREVSGSSGFQPEVLLGELKMLGAVRKRIDDDPVFIEAMWAAINNWVTYTKFAQEKGGAFQLPQSPKISFFVKFCAEAVAFAESGGGQVSDDFVTVSAIPTETLTKTPEVGENTGVMTHEEILKINAEFDDE